MNTPLITWVCIVALIVLTFIARLVQVMAKHFRTRSVVRQGRRKPPKLKGIRL